MLRVKKPISQLVSRKFHDIRKLHGEPKRHRHYSNDEYDKKDKNGGKEETRNLCLYKSKGQHLLTNQRVLDSIVRKSEIKPTDNVLEIGPGTGNLTLKLLEVANNVVAVEIDSRMVDILQKRVSERGFEDRLSIIRKDILKTELPQFDIVVANIPYNISSPVVAKLVYGPVPFRSATLLLQKEFARRMLAKPGDSDFNRLAANVNLMADVEHVIDVSRRDFVPSPKVDSSVVIIRPRPRLLPCGVNLEEWLAFTRACFGTKNKTLGAIFKGKRKVIELLGLTKNYDDDGDDDGEEECGSLDSRTSLFKEKIIRVLKSGGFEDKRPSKMCNEEFVCLLGMFNQSGIYFHDRSKRKARDYNEALVCDL